MKLKYVSNKSKFIDLAAARPRLMNLETTTKLLELHGIIDIDAYIVQVMQQPITTDDKIPPAPYLKIVEQYQIVARPSYYYVQGIKLDLSQALERLIGLGVGCSEALRALALAVDIADINK